MAHPQWHSATTMIAAKLAKPPLTYFNLTEYLIEIIRPAHFLVFLHGKQLGVNVIIMIG